MENLFAGDLMTGFLIATIAFVLAFGNSDLDSAVPRIERAVVHADEESLAQERDKLRQSLDGGPDDSILVLYTIAYIEWRSSAFHPQDSKESKNLLKAAEKDLKDLLKRAPENIEALALYAAVNGNLITSFWSGMRRGPRIGKALKKAEEAEPENPRLALIKGINAFFSPKMFGGGVEKAEKELRRAEELFSREAPDKLWPNWGRVDVLAWLGQVMEKKGQWEEAQSYYDRALALEPDHAWIGSVLLPALEKRMRSP
jgi:tetratricopeptide (TPR) repeat protein